MIDYFHQKQVGGHEWDGWMDGRMTPVPIRTRERKSLSEHNRKETEQKQAHASLDIKTLPAWGLRSASPPSSASAAQPHSSVLLGAKDVHLTNLYALHHVCEESNNCNEDMQPYFIP